MGMRFASESNPEQCRGPRPLHNSAHQVAAARVSTTSRPDFADAGFFNVGAARDDEEEMQTVVAAHTDAAAVLEVTAMKAKIEAFKAKNEATDAKATVKVANCP